MLGKLKSMQATSKFTHKRNRSDLVHAFNVQDSVKEKPKLLANRSVALLSKQKITPLRARLNISSEEEMKNSLQQALVNAVSVKHKIETLQKFWEKSIKYCENSLILNEIKDQLLNLIIDPANVSLIEVDSIHKQNQALKTSVEKEKAYALLIEDKTKALSLQNTKLFNKYKDAQEKLKSWMQLSAEISAKKSSLIEFEDLFRENRKLCGVIDKLKIDIEEQKAHELKLMEIIENQKKYVIPQELQRFMDPMFREFSKDYTDKSTTYDTEVARVVYDKNEEALNTLPSSGSQGIVSIFSKSTHNKIPKVDSQIHPKIAVDEVLSSKAQKNPIVIT